MSASTMNRYGRSWTLIVDSGWGDNVPHQWYIRGDWSENYPVAVLGSGRTYHVPILTDVSLRKTLSPNPNWKVLEKAGIQYHLHGGCMTGFWAPAWTIQSIGLLRALDSLKKIPYTACSKCIWNRRIQDSIREEEAILISGLT